MEGRKEGSKEGRKEEEGSAHMEGGSGRQLNHVIFVFGSFFALFCSLSVVSYICLVNCH